MIGLAGGTYVLNDRLSAEENALSTMNMQMEDFYAAAKDADILIMDKELNIRAVWQAGKLVQENFLNYK